MIGIIGAMDIEIEGLRVEMTDIGTKTISGIEFTKGLLRGVEVVTAVCGIGKVFAAMCAQTMLMEYNPDFIINTGVAGSLSTRLSVGDVAVAVAAVEHDMDTTALGDEPGFINGLGLVRLPADKALTEKLCAAAEGLGINYILGTVASGDQFISTREAKALIAEKFDAVACEMEGAAIGHVCYANNTPFAVARAISDSLTDGAGMEYEAFKHLAADMSNKMIFKFLDNM